MKTTNYRKMAITLGGILIATVAAGCYGGGSGYNNNSYGYNSGYRSSYSSYGSSYPYRSGGYHDQRAFAHDQRAVAVDRDRPVARTESTHASVDRDKVSLRDSGSANHVERN